MPCYHPLSGVRGVVNSNGKRPLIFGSDVVSRAALVVQVPCGQCVGCRLARSAAWATRCLDEASQYADNCFLTLTYDEAHLPSDHGLHVSDFQLFMKRLRQDVWRRSHRRGVRFFHCGEYGTQLKRPHFHACLFNLDFKDKVFYKRNRNGDSLFNSPTLSRLWPSGFSVIGDLTFESAAYVARYVVDKVTGPNVEFEGPDGLRHYERVHRTSGEVVPVMPEYTTMSRRPGIGRAWFDRYVSDVFPVDYRVVDGRRLKVPRFYDGLYEKGHPVEFDVVKRRRFDAARKVLSDNTLDRLYVKEEVKLAQIRSLCRPLEAV